MYLHLSLLRDSLLISSHSLTLASSTLSWAVVLRLPKVLSRVVSSAYDIKSNT